jgi:homoserine dehydrogenase
VETPVVRVGVVGAGTVGAALIGLITDPNRQAQIVDAATARVELVGVAVRDPARARDGVAPGLVTGDALALAARSDVDVLVEVAGGLDVARAAIEAALDRGASVVTANKALMAAAGTELAARADAHGADLFYEAAVGGGIPILRALRTSLAGERIERVMGIVNGTTNFILTSMSAEGRDYASALAEAQALGYAESDPTADVEGFDAAAKVQILSSLAYGTALDGSSIDREGITAVRALDVDFARRTGHVIKLLGVAERVGAAGLNQRVHPALIPVDHPLASVSGAMNAVFVEGARVGPLMWLGQGAGGAPTATAVLGDVLDAARNRVSGRHDAPFRVVGDLERVPSSELRSVFYLSVDVDDRPGVLAEVAGAFGAHGVSIRTMEQVGVGDEARLNFLTHTARTADVDATLDDLRSLPSVEQVGARLRVIGGEA